MHCPRCGSQNIENVVTSKTDTKGLGGAIACCGHILLGWLGFLRGLCRIGESATKAKTKFMCKNCGKRFK